ncbi:VWA domain-containing protein [candidate division KSB3 bacterium]|uniref:VWA domain-containing protein n=1 Tax=candidate division KSB3 bacterium TaxID=2044937 RepID=A0A9D5JVY3_9BACT|nr:VWA domain-containing protein [candidate division KSB3 bacterium]MBD3324922.1 VWA domain-containing protein [candidate division KSB3 bacterium]
MNPSIRGEHTMQREQIKSGILAGFFVIVIAVALGSLPGSPLFSTPMPPQQQPTFSGGNGPLNVSAQLVQDKIFSGGDGTASLSLTMAADDVFAPDNGQTLPVDMVIVLDQSGSMRGQKLDYAKQAILTLLSRLGETDRFALLGYADHVWTYAALNNVTATQRQHLHRLISNLSAGGNTNLGGGLQQGIAALLNAPRQGHVEKVILISDGLANRGIIAPEALGSMASLAVEEEFAVSTVGVGHDFNEQVMTTIADRGAGNYYYLAHPSTFAEIFRQEFESSQTVAARAVEITLALPDGISLLNASGYPITTTPHHATVHPGDLLSGQTRTFYLTLQLPTHAETSYTFSDISVRYLHQGTTYTATLADPFQIACVPNPDDALSSIDQRRWEEKVLQEDFNALREQVAVDLKAGKQEEALQRIDQYHTQQQIMNSEVGSATVATHLDEELEELRDFVEQTFSGSPQAVEQQQKANAKALQYEGYKERRAKN